MSETASPPGGESGGLVLVKWGGSLITDKTVPGAARQDVIMRLAVELAELATRLPGRLILGHGSGSFGHAAADRHGIAQGARGRDQLVGVGRTQDQAARLHRMVITALIEAGAAPFSVAPGSAVVAVEGRPAASGWEPVELALELGLVPVVFGDVVLDREQGSAILSTEAVFIDLVRDLLARGRSAPRAVWLGETAGVWDAEGKVLTRVGPEDLDRLGSAVGASGGTDVTGGMRHRLESALELLELGVESWIVDGREDRVVDRVLDGEGPGTHVSSRAG